MRQLSSRQAIVGSVQSEVKKYVGDRKIGWGKGWLPEECKAIIVLLNAFTSRAKAIDERLWETI